MKGCLKCGKCCDNILLNKSFFDTLAKLKDDRLGKKSFIDIHWKIKKEKEDAFVVICDLYNKKLKLCSDYENRPPVCSDYPLYEGCPTIKDSPVIRKGCGYNE